VAWQPGSRGPQGAFLSPSHSTVQRPVQERPLRLLAVVIPAGVIRQQERTLLRRSGGRQIGEPVAVVEELPRDHRGLALVLQGDAIRDVVSDTVRTSLHSILRVRPGSPSFLCGGLSSERSPSPNWLRGPSGCSAGVPTDCGSRPTAPASCVRSHRSNGPSRLSDFVGLITPVRTSIGNHS
jgi:hypothetical protein